MMDKVLVLYMLDIFAPDEEMIGIYTTREDADKAKKYFRDRLNHDYPKQGPRLYFRSVWRTLNKVPRIKCVNHNA